jgi:hypothetical protein
MQHESKVEEFLVGATDRKPVAMVSSAFAML